MGTNVIKKKNTFLNIIICNFNEEIQKMKFLENTQQTEPKEYIHKFYGWNFYDYGKDLDSRKIDKILDKLIFFCDKLEYQNVLLIFDNVPYEESNENNISLKF